jgi:hypothetical protein
MAKEGTFSANNSREAAELDAWLDQQIGKATDESPAGLSAVTSKLAVEMLELAAASEPDPVFAADLEQRLQAVISPAISHRPAPRTDVMNPTREKPVSRKFLVTAIVVVAFGLLASFASGLPMQQGSQPVVAAELWQRANAALVTEVGAAPFVYDRLALSWRSSGNVYENVTAELWQSTDGTQWRYQLSSQQGELLYFLQRDEGEVWQSIHTLPLGEATVTELFAHTAVEELPLPEGALLRRDAAVGWMDLDTMLAERAAACLDLYCLLGIDEDGAAGLAGVEEATWEDGRAVYVLEAALPAEFTRTLVLDRESNRLVAVEDRDRGELIARQVHLERRGMTAAELGETFFASVPTGLTLARTEEQAGVDRIWIVHTSPAPGSVVTATTPFEVVIGYELVSLPEALIDVALARPDFRPGPGGRLPVERGGRVEVHADGNEATITFALGPQELEWLGEAKVEMALWVLMGHFSGAHQISVVAGELFTDYQWTFVP